MSAISLFSIVPQPSAASPTISHSPTRWQKYLAERRPEVRLQEALQSGNLSGAETAYNNLVSLANTVLHQNNPFVRSDRAADSAPSATNFKAEISPRRGKLWPSLRVRSSFVLARSPVRRQPHQKAAST